MIFRILILTIVIAGSHAFSQILTEDSLALIAILEANPKTSVIWKDSTHRKQPVAEWDFVTVENNRIVKINPSRCNLTVLPPEIGHLTELRTLDLDKNNLTALPPEIGHLTKLEYLHLKYNELTMLPPEIAQLKALKKIDLYENELTELSPELLSLTSLEQLWVAFNKIEKLPSAIGNLVNLQSLSIDNNNISDIPVEIGNCTKLQSLCVHSNDITVLPSEIGNCTELTNLCVMANALGAIPKEIGNLTKLETLDIHKCELAELPKEIGNLVNLAELYADYNEIESIPATIGNCTKLFRLDLTANSISKLPKEMGNLNMLKYCHLDSNELTSIPDEMANIDSLAIIDLDHNQLDSLSKPLWDRFAIEFCRVNANKFTFADLVYPYSLNQRRDQFIFSGQATLPVAISGDSTTLSVEHDHEDNLYQWFMNGDTIPGETSPDLTIRINDLKENEFKCQITNSSVPKTTLYSELVGGSNDNSSIQTQVMKSKSKIYLHCSSKTLLLNLTESDKLSITLFDLKGRMVLKITQREFSAGSHSLQIKNVSSGMYVAQIQGKHTEITQKISFQ